MIRAHISPVRGDFWWGRGDLNPGPRTPQARILDQTGPRPRRTELRAFAPKILFVLPKLKAAGLADSSILSRYAFLV